MRCWASSNLRFLASLVIQVIYSEVGKLPLEFKGFQKTLDHFHCPNSISIS
ncbi:hypothetical protein GLYMA_05G141851v4 [Glycine max]|nr:hypothetical protein GLYMA_05G141851v4 [Glycine max]KAH1134332.1 hypothetical protein GYH30_012631 [Glycine max]